MQKIAKIIALWFGAGLSPLAPGTVGTLAALPPAWLLQMYLGAYGLLAAGVLLFFIGWWASARYVAETQKEDPSEVVVDEVAAMWLVLGFAPQNAMGYLIAFAAFRLFDITKPWPAGWSDKNIKGALGVMLDDILVIPHSLLIIIICNYYVL